MDQFSNIFVPSCHAYHDDNTALQHLDYSLPPEPQTGNIEYKLKIVKVSKQRFEHLLTQMKWRLREGQGEAIYKIGVEDNGILTGLSGNDMTDSLQTLEQMALKLGASTTILRQKVLDNGRYISERILKFKVANLQNIIETRIAVVGNADAGKSTLLGVLVHGDLDNGRGKARLSIFRHLHEIRSGRTSSISHKTIGFNSQGTPINYDYSELMSAEDIYDASTKLITFLDLAGHKKYIHTTIQGLSGYSPHYAMLVISSTTGAVDMTYEHLSIATTLNLHFFIVITKIDLVDANKTLESLEKLLKFVGCQKIPFLVKNLDDVISGDMLKEELVPILCVSSVNGEGLDLLLKFLHRLPSNNYTTECNTLQKDNTEFQVNEIFRSSDTVQILGGLLVRGIVSERSQMQIGPFNDGTFKAITLKSVHHNHIPCRTIQAGQSATISLETYPANLRIGMMLLNENVKAFGSFFFQASISLIYHETVTICIGSEFTIYAGNIRQTAVTIAVFESSSMHTNELKAVLFKFKNYPEYICIGQKLLFRNGVFKGTGEITQVFPILN
ncbi:elongation factor tu-related [Holotrichia oblita]|uniref:Elongation factor tu-related n=1 Tax=Holotrichia oblita TaxID=644536 RepID=A0ACB9TL43_HOLOL|nr:elongation factor tu-related [Holotrichia oblita]